MQPTVHRDTRAWQLQVWTTFGIALFLCAVGLAWLDRAFIILAYFFCLATAFVRVKFVRDDEKPRGRPAAVAE
jgi:hypothetical protein